MAIKTIFDNFQELVKEKTIRIIITNALSAPPSLQMSQAIAKYSVNNGSFPSCSIFNPLLIVRCFKLSSIIEDYFSGVIKDTVFVGE